MTPVPSSPVALLDQLDELRAKATPGEWAVYWGDHIGSGVVKTSPGGVQVDYDICEMQDEDDRACTDNEFNPASPSADAALIVAAVNAVGPLTAAVRIADDALAVIDRNGCENFYGGRTRCLDARSGRTRGARFGADSWCDACVARDALTQITAALSVTP